VIFPATMADMLRGGYVFLQTQDGPDCRRLVYLFRTPRRRSVGPFVKTPRGGFVSHFAVCEAVRIRAARISSPGQGELFPSSEVVSSFGP
jgi:hypothetical protein